MVLPEEEQRSWKRRIVRDVLARIGRFENLPVEAPLEAPPVLGYRNRVELTFGVDADGRRRLGYHAADARMGLVDVERCLLQDDVGNRVLLLARAFFVEGPGHALASTGLSDEPPRIVIRRSAHSGRVLVALRGPADAFPQADAFAGMVREAAPEVASVVRLIARPGRRGGTRVVPLVGPPWIEESLGGILFRLPAAAFCQVNPTVGDRLVDLVQEIAAPVPGSRVLELYGGVGVFSLALSRRGARAHVCEADPEAVACGREATRAHGDLPVTFACSDVAAFLRRPQSPRERPDIVIADPPRTGLGRGVAAAIARLSPRRVALVSCDPATLARDARTLADGGYVPRRVVPVDMFPQTPHLETVMLLERES